MSREHLTRRTDRKRAVPVINLTAGYWGPGLIPAVTSAVVRTSAYSGPLSSTAACVHSLVNAAVASLASVTE